MALLQRFPHFEALVESVDVKQTLVEKKPEVVAFVVDANMRVVVDRVLENKFVQIDAAPGAGKSTRLPQYLVERGLLVVHVLPYVHMAAAIKHRCEIQNGVGSVVSVFETTDEWPETGYVVTYAGCVAAKWLALGKPVMPTCVLLHDESHESDAASALIRSLAVTIGNLISYVRMSATSDVKHFRNGKVPGEVVRREFQEEAFENPWSVNNVYAPWAIAAIKHLLIIYEDDNQRAIDLVQAYTMSGITVFRWNHMTKVETFLSDYKLINANPGSVYVVVADATFRSGFTFEADVIVDSGRVQRKVVEKGVVRYHSRLIHQFETVQTSARGGRIPGLKTIYWKPRAAYQNVLCNLEQTDIEAYVMMLNLMNYVVPDKYVGAIMNQDKFPKDVCSALNDGTPLAVLPESALVTRRELMKNGDGKFKADIAVSLVDKEFVKSDLFGRKDVFAFVDAVHSETDDVYQEPLVSNLMICNVDLGDVPENVKAYFPRGFASLASYHGSGNLEGLISVMQDDDVGKILQMAVDEHNSALLTVRSIDLGIKEARQSSIRVEPKILRSWVIRYTEKMVISCATAELAMKIAVLIAKQARYVLRQCECDLTDLEPVKVKMKRELDGMPRLLEGGDKIRNSGYYIDSMGHFNRKRLN